MIALDRTRLTGRLFLNSRVADGRLLHDLELRSARRALEANVLDGLSAWAGQSAARARAVPAAQVARELWDGARALLEPA